MLKRYKYQHHDKCPCCNIPNETMTHILLCDRPSAQTLWKSKLDSLVGWMIMSDVAPDISIAIISNLKRQHLNLLPVDTSNGGNVIIPRAIRKQTDIDLNLLLEGFWIKNWEEIQQLYFMDKNSPKYSVLLMSKTKCRAWEIAWSMWLYCNNILHSENRSIHPQEQLYLDKELQYKWQHGISNLPPQYQHKFHISLNALLCQSCTAKINWLLSVWTTIETSDSDYLSCQIFQYR